MSFLDRLNYLLSVACYGIYRANIDIQYIWNVGEICDNRKFVVHGVTGFNLSSS